MSIKVFYKCISKRCGYVFEAAISAKNFVVKHCPRCRSEAKFLCTDLNDDEG